MVTVGPTAAETALYYFTSSIAQALPTAFGVLGAFAAYKLHHLGQRLVDTLSILGETCLNREKALKFLIASAAGPPHTDVLSAEEIGCSLMKDCVRNHDIPGTGQAFQATLEVYPHENREFVAREYYPEARKHIDMAIGLDLHRLELRRDVLTALRVTSMVVVAALATIPSINVVVKAPGGQALVYVVGTAFVCVVLYQYYVVIRTALGADPFSDISQHLPSLDEMNARSRAEYAATQARVGHSLWDVLRFIQGHGPNPLRRLLARWLSARGRASF